MRSHFNLPSIILASYLSRLLYTGASVGDALVIIGLSGLYAGYVYLDNKKQPQANKDLWDRVVALEEQLKIAKDKVNALSLASGLRKNV